MESKSMPDSNSDGEFSLALQVKIVFLSHPPRTRYKRLALAIYVALLNHLCDTQVVVVRVIDT